MAVVRSCRHLPTVPFMFQCYVECSTVCKFVWHLNGALAAIGPAPKLIPFLRPASSHSPAPGRDGEAFDLDRDLGQGFQVS